MTQYNYISDLVDPLEEEDQTTYVKSKIQIAEMKNKSENGERQLNVFACDTKKGNCFKC